MQKLVGVMYDEKPEQVVVGKTIVDVLVSATEVEQEDEQTGEISKKWKCNIDRYETTEYIDVLQQDNKRMDGQINDTQMALVEVYEMILG